MTRIECNIGAYSCCEKCRVYTHHPSQVIHASECLEDTVAAVLSGDYEGYMLKKFLGQPAGCPLARARIEEYRVSNSWLGMKDGAETATEQEVVVLSDGQPSLSGEVELEGLVFHNRGSVVLYAHDMKQQDLNEVDLRPILHELRQRTPWENPSMTEIETYLSARAIDLSANVTKIYGRHELHVSADLLAHSGLWMDVDGMRKRAWLDTANIGETRTGKSEVFRRMFAFHGLGVMHTCMENISRAGLTMGAQNMGRMGMKVKPGLLPRMHKKMVALDEAHLMVGKSKNNPLEDLQSARDVGTIGGIKIYGPKIIPAAVRLAVIGNWARGRKEAYEFPAEHLLFYYGVPESLSRLDFGLVIMGPPSSFFVEAEHVWGRELVRALILRAWMMKPEDIIILPEALELARAICQDWSKTYHDHLPLYTPMEKVFSLLRIAIAVANIRFSHPKDAPHKCIVRCADVDWAAYWLMLTWTMCHYDKYSASMHARSKISKPYQVEVMLINGFSCAQDPEDLRNLLNNFFHAQQRGEIQILLGKEPAAAETWISTMVSLNFLQKSRDPNAHNVKYELTAGGYEIAKNIMTMCEEYPEELIERRDRLKRFSPTTVPDVPPINSPINELRKDWDGKRQGTTNIFSF